jgi:hypothetical protein
MRARAAMVAAGLLVGALPLTPASADPRCTIELDRPTRGTAAVSTLGAHLPTAARAAGLNAALLERTLKTDPTLWLDECARPFYVEPADPSPDAASTDPAAVEDALTLHSRPDSALTLYLDFDGHDAAGTVWSANYGGDFTAEAYSIDSDPGFNATELARIAGVWQRVAEDYAPFDVDVTTEDPGPAAITRSSVADNEYGTRVVISPTNTIYSSCSCGGVAYIGVFDTTSSHAYMQPAWVFTRGVGTGSKNIAEAASHEAGHNLGLGHDGSPSSSYYSGHGVWAPIMGVGYYKPLSQWSRGDYTGANNHEDDLAVISSNGPAPVTDDIGDTRATASSIHPGSTTDEISSRGDIDWFRFTASGSTTVTVDPLNPGGNLDVALGIYGDDGAELRLVDPLSTYVSSDSATGLAAATTLTVPAGTYLAKVDGVGAGTVSATGYSDYGSLGRYTLTLATTTPLLVLGTPPEGTVDQPYTAQMSASGGTAPYSWALESGDLPDGLTLSTQGSLEGIPTTAGAYPLAIRVTDAAAQSATAQMVVRVAALPEVPEDGVPPAPPASTPAPPPTVPTPTTVPASRIRITTKRLPRATKGKVYRKRLTAAGEGTLTWTADKVPGGLRLRADGVLRGIPRRSGTHVVRISVQDTVGHTARATWRLRIRQ